MLTPLSILSLNQGNLSRKPTSEEEYFARYAEAPEVPAAPQRPSFLHAGWFRELVGAMR